MQEKAVACNRNKIATFLTFTVIIESGTGLVPIVLPPLLMTLLFDSFTNTTNTSTVARVAGVNIFHSQLPAGLSKTTDIAMPQEAWYAQCWFTTL